MVFLHLFNGLYNNIDQNEDIQKDKNISHDSSYTRDI